jgi:hypothetical protein
LYILVGSGAALEKTSIVKIVGSGSLPCKLRSRESSD